ncbi:hypothetical protein MNBD_PLANCTO02-1034 [hydrothermal vent metagenome]|uniref:Polysaccharide chain length determinant N-terminal domain-containing protein n=1 Tax=hydrothermal vent metagenome TaxID=652676 RepID=A0A3B1D6D3_9ZZZZ
MSETKVLSKIYIETFQRRWLLLLASVVCAVIPGVFYLQKAEPVYETQIRALIQNNGLSINSNARHNKDREFLSTQAEIVRSPLIIRRSFEILPPSPTLEPDVDPVAQVAKSLSVSPLVSTDIIRLSYRNSDPERSVKRLQAIIESYQQYLREIEQGTSDETVELLENQEETLEKKRKNLEEKIIQIHKESPFIGEPGEIVRTETAALKELASQLVVSNSKRNRIENILKAQVNSNVTKTQNVILLDGIDTELSRTLRELQSNFWQAESNVQKLSRVYGPLHPERKQAEDQAVALKKQYVDVKNQVVASLKHQLEISRSEEKNFQQRYNNERERLSQLDHFLLQEEQLQSELKRVNQAHESTVALLRQKQLNKEALAGGQASILVKVLDEYMVPKEPVWPLPAPLLIACGLLGLLLGLVVIVFIEKLPLPGMQFFDTFSPETTNPMHNVSNQTPVTSGNSFSSNTQQQRNSLQNVVSNKEDSQQVHSEVSTAEMEHSS